MTAQTLRARASRGRIIGYYLAVVAGVLLVVSALFEAFPLTVTAWLSAASLEELYGGEVVGIDSHRLHLFGVAILAWLLLIPVLLQLFRPASRLAAAIFAMAVIVMITVTDLLSGLFDPVEIAGLVILGAVLWLHPSRAGLSYGPMRRRALAMSLVGAVGWLIYALVEYVQQFTGSASDAHVELGHFGMMGLVALLIVVGALIGASALVGNRMVAVLSAGAAAYLGVASMVFPGHESSLGVAFGALALLWVIAYLWSVFSEKGSTTG